MKRGRRIRTMNEFVRALKSEPSIWWCGKPRPSAFLSGWMIRTVLAHLHREDTGFYLVNRKA